MFEKIKLDSKDININELADTVMLGPQREILELVDEFNFQFNTDIGVTKTFRWSPGIYDKIRRAFTSTCLGWNVPTRKISTFFNKIEDSGWRSRNMSQRLRTLDDMLFNMRSDGTIFRDNGDIVKEKFKLMQNAFQESEVFDELIDIEVFIDKDELNKNQGLIYFLCSIPKGYPMKVFVADPNNDKHLVDMEYPWPVEVCFQIPLLQWLNKICSTDLENINTLRQRYTGDRGFMSKIGSSMNISSAGRYIGNEYSKLKHPYFQSRYNSRDSRNVFKYICLGEKQTDLIVSLLQLDLKSFMYHLKEWAGYYVINRTNPMNPITHFYYGSPDINPDFYSIVGTSESSNCSYPNDHMPNEIPYCDLQSCGFRTQCSWYIDNFEDDIEDKKLAYLFLISEMSGDNVEDLHERLWHGATMKMILDYYYDILLIFEKDQKLFSFMLFIRDLEMKLRKEDEQPYTIKNSLEELYYWYDEEGRVVNVDEILADSEFIIHDTFSYFTRKMDDLQITFKKLEINFELLNSHYKWIDESKAPKELPVWVNLKNNSVVSHGNGWIEHGDGVWRKVDSEIPF